MQENQILLWMETGAGKNQKMELRIRPIPKQIHGEISVQITGRDGYERDGKASLNEDGEAVFAFPDVTLWDMEHPVLYQVRAALFVKGKKVAEKEQSIGFRTIEKKGKQILWNHVPLKLKGICYRERQNDWEGTRKDMALFAGANINFIRSIYAPFSVRLLALCDEMGFLVENTAPFWEIGQAKKAEQDLPHMREQFMEPVKEMMNQGSHVSVAIWSLGHDCAWGANFREAAAYIRSIDNVRPLTFHLPMSIPDEDIKLDIWPVHYIDWKQTFDVCYDQMVIFHTPGTTENEIGYQTAQASCELPVLHEVWSPVPNHNRDEIEHDYGIHTFWQESIKRFAERSYHTPGCLGGAVLAGVDEDGSFEDMGNYKWGILDKDHQPKPEYAAVREAYAPVQVKEAIREADTLYLTIENRFRYTNLTKVRLTLQGICQEDIALKADCGEEEKVTVDLSRIDRQKLVSDKGFVTVAFQTGENILGEYVFELEEEGEKECEQAQPLKVVSEETQSVVIANDTFSYTFSKEDCLLVHAMAGGKIVLAGGPYLNSTGLTLGSWKGKKLFVKEEKDKVQVTITGSYEGVIDLKFILLLSGDGRMDVSYEPVKVYRHMPHTVKADTGMAPGGLNEKGVSFLLPCGAVDFTYRDVRNQCSFDLTDRQQKKKAWGSRYEIRSAAVDFADGSGIKVLSDGKDSVRLEAAPWYTPLAMVDDRDERMCFTGSWYRMNDYCGDYKETETLSRVAGDTMKLIFKGTGFSLYGPLDFNHGKCRITLDGQVLCDALSQFPDKVDFPGMSRGYEKRYRNLMCEAHDLEEKEHELLVTVLGKCEAAAQNTYTAIDYAVLEGSGYPEGILLHVNQDYNFNRLVRGCYKRPKVELTEGVREHFVMKLCAGRK